MILDPEVQRQRVRRRRCPERHVWWVGDFGSSSAFMQNGIVEVQVQPCPAPRQSGLAATAAAITARVRDQRLRASIQSRASE